MKNNYARLTQEAVEDFCAKMPALCSGEDVLFPNPNRENLLAGDPFHPMYELAREQEGMEANVLGMVDVESVCKLAAWTKAEAALWAVGLCIPSQKFCRLSEGYFRFDESEKKQFTEYLEIFFRGAPEEDEPSKWIAYAEKCNGVNWMFNEFRQCLGEKIFIPHVLKNDAGDDGLTKREKQIRAIEVEVEKMGYEKLAIPTGGKTALMAACKKNYPQLFGAGNDPFRDAWKVAGNSKPPRISMADRSKFSPKK